MFSKKPELSKQGARSWTNKNRKLLILAIIISGKEQDCLEHHHVNDHSTHQTKETMDVTTILMKKRKENLVLKITLDPLTTSKIQTDSCVNDLKQGSRIQMMMVV